MKIKDLLLYNPDAEIKIDGFDSIVSVVNSDEEEVILDPGINIPEWRKYSEKEPESYKNLLVTYINRKGDIKVTMAVYSNISKAWLDCDTKLSIDVIAWMELPKPYSNIKCESI